MKERTKPPCSHCGVIVQKPWGEINRAQKLDRPIYCGRVCSGLAHRSGKTLEQKKEEKRLYDIEYRKNNLEEITRKKSEHFRKTYDPVKAAEKRKLRMPQHVEYCRRPEYKRWKRGYDQQYRAKKQYGEFGEAAIILCQIEKEVLERGGDRFQRAVLNGTLNKKQTRRRDYERINSN